MVHEKISLKADDLWRLRLDEKNPRHEPKSQQQDIVDYLTANEDVLPLLEDVALIGLNPLERFGALRTGPKLLTMLEGNRRLCALTLLNDPELAPAKYKKRVQAAAEAWDTTDLEIDLAVFDSREEADQWIERRHQGALGGRGLRQWSPAAKDRHFGTSANALALRLLKDGFDMNLITESEFRSRVVTTVKRFSDRVPFRRTYLAISTSASDPDYATDLNEEVFKERLRVFLWDLFADEPGVTSRMSAKEIEAWVDAKLGEMPPTPEDGDELQQEDPAKSESDQSANSGDPDSGDTAETESESELNDDSSGRPETTTSDDERGSTPADTSKKEDEAGPPKDKVSKPKSPSSRQNLVDGSTFPENISDPLRRHVHYELSRVNRATPLAATVVARVFLEGIYIDMWDRTCTGKRESKLHVKAIEIIKVLRTWDLTRAEKNGLHALQQSSQDPTRLLSPAGMGAAAHGASYPNWDQLVSEWDSLLPITRRILGFVETSPNPQA